MSRTSLRSLRAALLTGTTAGCLVLSGMGQTLHAQTTPANPAPATMAQSPSAAPRLSR